MIGFAPLDAWNHGDICLRCRAVQCSPAADGGLYWAVAVGDGLEISPSTVYHVSELEKTHEGVKSGCD
jgi:hypothetical protein